MTDPLQLFLNSYLNTAFLKESTNSMLITPRQKTMTRKKSSLLHINQINQSLLSLHNNHTELLTTLRKLTKRLETLERWKKSILTDTTTLP